MPQVTASTAEQDERAIVSTMSFRAVFAGWLIATGIACLLYCAGLALGFSSFDAWNAGGSAKGIGIGTAVWMVLTWVTALFLGAMFASWFDGRDDDTSGALHGVTVWGLSVTVTAMWLTLALSHAVGPRVPTGREGAPPGTMDTHSQEARAMTGSDAVEVLRAKVEYRLSSPPGGAGRNPTPIVTALIAGKDDVASALLAARTGATQADAASSLQRLAPEVQAARRETRQAADRASHYAAMTLWIVFLSAFLALVAAAIGGWLGATFVHRVYHLRYYRRRPGA